MTATPVSRTRSRRARGRGGCLLVAVVLAAGLVLAAIVAVLAGQRLYSPGGAAGPRVQIRVPSPGARVSVQRQEIVVIEAYEAPEIARYELWVDGSLARYQLASDASGWLPGSTQLGWRPAAAGVHVLVARAYDARGRMGMSSPVLVEAAASGPDDLVLLRIVVQPGDTVESLAAAYGIAPDDIRRANPGLSEPLGAGLEIIVPVPRADLPPGAFGSEEEDSPSAPQPDVATPPPAPQGEGEGEAEPAPEGNAGPGQPPWGLGAGPEEPPVAPAELQLALTGGCGVQLRWSDNSQTETGFRVYRFGNGNRGFQRIAELAANQEVAWLLYEDRVPLGGTWLYYVAAVNAGGESGSPIAQIDVPRDGCALQVPPQSGQAMLFLQFEAVSLSTTSQFDGVYCYLSLAQLEPFARIPEGDEAFFAQTRDHGWDIAGWAAGTDRFLFGQPPDEPVLVKLECWGLRGREVFPLGAFSALHPREDWDGRNLHANTDEFRVSYRIQPYANLPALRPGEPDRSIPAPRNLRPAAGLNECLQHANLANGHTLFGSEGRAGLWACAEIWDQLLVWDWTPNRETPRAQIDGFRVYANRDYAGDPREDDPQAWESLGEGGSVNEIFPIPRPPCGQVYGFQVEAFAGGFPERRSARSATATVAGPPCANRASVEVSLEALEVSDLDDGCLLFCDGETLQAYGWGWFTIMHTDGTWDNGPDVGFWQEECINGEGSWCALEYRVVRNERIEWTLEDLRLCPPCDDYGPGQNRVALTLSEGDELSFRFWLYDSDDVEDDIWCGTTEDEGFGDTALLDLFDQDLEAKPVEIGPFTLEEWAGMDQVFAWDNSGDALSDQDARCTLTIRAHGLGRVP